MQQRLVYQEPDPLQPTCIQGLYLQPVIPEQCDPTDPEQDPENTSSVSLT